MADVITRFKLETSQYDSKLRDSANALKEVIHLNELAGKDFREFSDSAIQAARALGQQATGATNAKDKVKELVSAYNSMAKTYNEMSDAMKNSEGGKALAASLGELQQRIKDAKAEMTAAPGMLDKLASKFTVNIDAIKLFNLGLQAAEGALSVAKDAFFANETQLDDWGRTVESSKSLYSGFLDALNTGDISGYLQRIDDITKAARAAYNALDELNTFNAFNQINVEKTRTGMTESIADYRSGQGSKETVKAAGAAYQKELRERQRLEREAYRKAVMEKAAERGVNGNDLLMALSGSYGSYQSLKAIPMTGRRLVNYGGGMFGGGGTYEQEFAANRQEKLGAALRRLNDTELQSLQALGAQAERTGNEIAQVDKQLTRVLNGRQPGEGGTNVTRTVKGGTTTATAPTYAADSIAAQQALVSQLSKQWSEAGADVRNDYLTQLIAAEEVLKRMKDEATMFRENSAGRLLERGPIQTTGLGMVTGSFKNAKVEGLSPNLTNQGKSLAEDGKNVAAEWQSAASAIGAVGAAMSQIEDPAAKVMGTIAQAIATIALTFASSLKGTVTPWDWIAAAAAGTATMISTISAIHSATGYAQGGIVKGNSYSGDNIGAMIDGGAGGFAGLNAGEVVLTKAMQNNLAGQLQGGDLQNMRLEAVVTAEQIRFMLNSNGRRTGRGEYVTTNFR